MLLRADTRVTNHGFTDGRANAIESVLQAGSAVLVDERGAPVVRCACGNPLLAPQAVNNPVYVNTAWPRWSPDQVVVVQQTTVIIDVFVLVDPVTGETFNRPRGTDGSDDEPTEPDEPTTTTTSTTEPTTTTTGATSDGSADDAIAIVRSALCTALG